MTRALLLACVAVALPSAAQAPVSIHVAGRVVDEQAGTGIQGARVMLMLTTMPSAPQWVRGLPPPRTTTDVNGAFALDVSFAGSYRVVVSREGFVRSSAAPTIDVVEGHSLEDVVLPLGGGGSIAGRVRNADGRANGSFTVIALRRRVDADGHVSTSMGSLGQPSADGSFRISTLPAGEYVVVAAPLPSAPRPASDATTTVAPTFFPGTTDLQTAQAILVTMGDAINGIDFQLTSAAVFAIEGTVVRGDGTPVARALVFLTWDPRNAGAGPIQAVSAWSGDDGTFTLTGVVPGNYLLTASVPIPRQPGDDTILLGPDREALSSAPPASPRASLGVTVGSEGVRNLRLVLR